MTVTIAITRRGCRNLPRAAITVDLGFYAPKRTMAHYQVPSSATIEDLLTYVELDSNDDSWIDVQAVKRALNEFVFETIQHFIKPHYGGYFIPSTEGWIKQSPNCYDKLIGSLVNRTKSNCFICFNYDLLLDHALWVANPVLPANYNLQFTHVDLFPQYKDLLDGKLGSINNDLLKLHGSMNWARCEKCEGIQLVYYRDYYELFKMGCKQCGSLLSPILVPPTLRKNIKHYGLTKLWDKAEEALSTTNNITIIGYSFPDADMEAKWLFKKGIAKGGRKPHLTLVDPSIIVRKKIKDFLGETVSDVLEIKDFETYVDKLNHDN